MGEVCIAQCFHVMMACILLLLLYAPHGLSKLQTSSRQRNSKYFHSITIFTSCFVVRFTYHPGAVSLPAIFVKRHPALTHWSDEVSFPWQFWNTVLPRGPRTGTNLTVCKFYDSFWESQLTTNNISIMFIRTMLQTDCQMSCHWISTPPMWIKLLPHNLITAVFA